MTNTEADELLNLIRQYTANPKLYTFSLNTVILTKIKEMTDKPDPLRTKLKELTDRYEPNHSNGQSMYDLVSTLKEIVKHEV